VTARCPLFAAIVWGALAASAAAQEPAPPVRGPADAPIAVVVYVDFDAETATRAMAVLESFRAAHPDLIRIEFHDHLRPDDEPARVAHRAARAAHNLGRFWEMHDLLLLNQDRRTRADLIAMARQIGLDEAAFASRLDDATLDREVDADTAAADQRKLPAGVAVLVGGQLLPGVPGLEALERVLRH
jgi:protein-disulfide isomerase